MLKRFLLSVLSLAVAISSLCPQSQAQDLAPDKAAQKPAPAAPAKQAHKPAAISPEEQVYQRGAELLDRLKKATEKRKASLHEFVGKECHADLGEGGCDLLGPQPAHLTRANLDEAFSQPLENLSKARKELDNRHQEMLQKKLPSGDFVWYAYRIVEHASGPDWKGEVPWPLLVVQVLRPPAMHAQERADAEYKKTVDEAWPKEDYKALVAEAGRKWSETLKPSFAQAATDFQKLMYSLRDDRKSMVEELWCFQEFADQLSKSTSKPVSDTHADGARLIKEALRGHDEREHFPRWGPLTVFYHVGLEKNDWLKSVPFQDVYDVSSNGPTLDSGFMKLASIASLHPKDCPGAQPPEILTKIRKGTAPGAQEGVEP